ncbi:MAG TPA: aspartate kinase, partial [Bacteroidales bacterium]|nr:aspartate kinase [Bacteroidales bacterium]
MEVFKFGGASIKDAVSIKNVPVVLEHFKNKKIVVIISAMGKTTNALEQLLRSYFNRQEDTPSHLQNIKDFHFTIIKELFPEENHPVYADINQLFDKMEKAIAQPPDANFDYQYDRIVHFGEVISSKILWHFLNYSGIQAAWMDITNVLVTNNEFRNAKVNWQKTHEQIQKHLVPVIDSNPITVLQGFIGKSETGSVVTLGREGSDYSAAIIAYCTDAESVTIWKDVDGVLNADPKFFADTQIIENISYADAVEMAYYGASVIHPKTIKPLENKNIPLYVKPFANPSAAGT